MPMQDWYAPSLLSSKEAGVRHWKREDIASLLRTGVSPSASYLQSLPEVLDYAT